MMIFFKLFTFGKLITSAFDQSIFIPIDRNYSRSTAPLLKFCPLNEIDKSQITFRKFCSSKNFQIVGPCNSLQLIKIPGMKSTWKVPICVTISAVLMNDSDKSVTLYFAVVA